jgi:tRNA pseudouridine38-40 synthase
MRNYKIVLSYDGTDYSGWQRQPKRRTIQGTLEGVLARITQRDVSVVGAGRTDAGVHALGQAAHFKAAVRMTESEFRKALNALLPDDIRVIDLYEVAVEFHARRDAKSKTYQYRIWNAPEISPFLFRYALHVPYPLSLGPMRLAARLFVREDDFMAFSSNRELRPRRSVTRSELRRRGNEILYTIEASGFLRYMVRTIVGTLLEVGRGRLAPNEIGELFKNRTRTLASPTAPAKGLCLLKIVY